MKSGFYYSKLKQNKSIKILNLLFKYNFTIQLPKIAIINAEVEIGPTNRKTNHLPPNIVLNECHYEESRNITSPNQTKSLRDHQYSLRDHLYGCKGGNRFKKGIQKFAKKSYELADKAIN